MDQYCTSTKFDIAKIMIVALDQCIFLINPFGEELPAEGNFEKDFKKELVQWTKQIQNNINKPYQMERLKE